NFENEYLPALFLYSLAVVKYVDNHGAKAARLAFGTAGVVGRQLTPLTPPPPVDIENEPKAPLKHRLKGLSTEINMTLGVEHTERVWKYLEKAIELAETNNLYLNNS